MHTNVEFSHEKFTVVCKLYSTQKENKNIPNWLMASRSFYLISDIVSADFF